MRSCQLFVLLATTAVMPSAAMAQAATAADCDQLITMIEQHTMNNGTVTLDQARSYKKDNNVQACHDDLARAGAPGATNKTQITVKEPAPAVRVQQAAPQVTVQQSQPTVTVNQPQPEITVHQPAPTVTVNIPQPEITIRMPKPDVNVSTAQPAVEVNQPKPQVQVVQPTQAQPDVKVQQAASSPNVIVQDSKQAPKITYQRDQAKVVVNQPQGAPTVHMEQADQPANGSAQSGTAAAPATQSGTAAAPATQSGTAAAPAAQSGTAAAPAVPTQGDLKSVPASRVMHMNVKNAHGDKLGDVEHVLMHGPDNKPYVVIGHGGFLGLGEKKVALPVDSMFLRRGELVMRGLTDNQIRAMPNWNQNDHSYRDFTANQPVEISTSG